MKKLVFKAVKLILEDSLHILFNLGEEVLNLLLLKALLIYKDKVVYWSLVNLHRFNKIEFRRKEKTFWGINLKNLSNLHLNKRY